MTQACNSAIASVYVIAYAFVYRRNRAGRSDPPDLTVLPGRLEHHFFLVGCVVVTCVGLTFFLPSHTTATEILGFFADMGSLSMYVSPLTALTAVLRERDATSLPLPYSTACLLNGIAWTVYGGVVVDEIVIWAPSVVGIILASIQLGFILLFGQKGSNRDAKETVTGGAFELQSMVGGSSKDKRKIKAKEDFDVESINGEEENGDDAEYGLTDDDDNASHLDFAEDIEDDEEFDSFINGK